MTRKQSKLNLYSPERLKERLKGKVNLADLALEFPIHYLEEVTGTGALADGPGLGERAVWMNGDCSLASGFEIQSADIWSVKPEFSDQLHAVLGAAMSELDYGEELQFIWQPWDSAGNLLDRFGQSHPGDPIYSKYWRAKLAAREQARFDQGDLRRFRTFCFLNSMTHRKSVNPYGITEGGLHDLFGLLNTVTEATSLVRHSLDGLSPDQYADEMRRLISRLSAMEKVLERSPLLRLLPLRALDVFDLLRRGWAHDMWKHDRKLGSGRRAVPEVDARSAPLAAYFLIEGVEDRGNEFVIGRTHHRILTMDTTPKASDVGMIPMMLCGGKTMREVTQIQCVMVMKPASRSVEMEKLRRRIRMLTGQKSGTGDEHRDNDELIKLYIRRLADLRAATRPSMFNTHFQIHLWHDDLSVLDRWTQQVQSVLDGQLGMVVRGGDADDFNSFPFYVGFNQPGYTRLDDDSRSHALTPGEAAVLAPLAASGDGSIGAGSRDPLPILFETDLGCPFGIDLIPTGVTTNYGGFGVGVPGSGKTNTMERIVTGHVGPRTDIIIIDGADQPGFRTIVPLLGGRNIMFDDSFRINPLATKFVNGVQSNPGPEEMDGILLTLGAMVRGTRSLEPIEAAVLTSAVRYAFENREGDPSRVAFANFPRGLRSDRFDSEKEKALADEFRRVITETFLNRYGNIFSGVEDIPYAPVINFEVTKLMEAGQEQLRPVILSILFRYVERLSRENLARPAATRRKLIFIADEAWKALNNRALVGQIVSLYRTGRARNMSPHLLSQSFADMEELRQLSEEETSDGQKSSPVLACSSHMFFFNLQQKDAEAVGRAFDLDGDQVKKLTRLGGEPGQYRDFVYLLKTGDGMPHQFRVLRSRILPEERWATSTSADDDGKRVSMMALVDPLLKQKASRDRLISDLRRAGWPVEDGATDVVIKQAAMLHYLTNNQTPKAA